MSLEAALSLAAPAKINLYLGVLPGKMDNGYHEVHTLMAPLALADKLTVYRFDTGSELDKDFVQEEKLAFKFVSEDLALQQLKLEDNSLYKAVKAFVDSFGQSSNYAFELHKHIPAESGLGGSSTDGGTALRALALLEGIALDDEKLVQIAQSIGSDLRFFLDPKPSFFEAKGDALIESFELSRDIPLVLMRPDLGVSTPACYKRFDEDPAEPVSHTKALAALKAEDLKAVAANLYNNLAAPAKSLVPELSELEAWLATQDEILGSLLCGSGSAYFGLCESIEAAQLVAARAKKDMKCWAEATAIIGTSAANLI